MGMTAGVRGRRIQAEINVTPMVDIMLVLLIIFLVVSPLLQSGRRQEAKGFNQR